MPTALARSQYSWTAAATGSIHTHLRASNAFNLLSKRYGGDNDLINDHTPILAARAAGLSVTLTHGCDVATLDRSGFAAAVAAANAADVIVFFGALDFAWESGK